jgi:XTP/dITP diphosphohydrolase
MTTSPLDLVIGTFNQGKLLEVSEALAHLPLSVRYLRQFPDVSPVPESGQTYRENAILKAKGYANQTRLLTLADDSGLEVDALDGRPGVFSARFGGVDASDKDRIALLLSELAAQPQSERSARFVCCMALADGRAQEQSSSEPEMLTVVEGKCEGVIALVPSGSNGFGFDPVFIPTGYERTFADLANEVKARISHRAKALAQVCRFLEGWRSVA